MLRIEFAIEIDRTAGDLGGQVVLARGCHCWTWLPSAMACGSWHSVASSLRSGRHVCRARVSGRHAVGAAATSGRSVSIHHRASCTTSAGGCRAGSNTPSASIERPTPRSSTLCVGRQRLMPLRSDSSMSKVARRSISLPRAVNVRRSASWQQRCLRIREECSASTILGLRPRAISRDQSSVIWLDT